MQLNNVGIAAFCLLRCHMIRSCNDKSAKYKYSLNICVMDDEENYPTLRKDIYIGGIG